MDASFCGRTVVAAIGFVAHTDAVIFDLRQNCGGQPAMVTLIRELPVRSANTPDRHIQPEGGLDGAELDAVAVSVWTT
jgi:hypothetical protein